MEQTKIGQYFVNRDQHTLNTTICIVNIINLCPNKTTGRIHELYNTIIKGGNAMCFQYIIHRQPQIYKQYNFATNGFNTNLPISHKYFVKEFIVNKPKEEIYIHPEKLQLIIDYYEYQEIQIFT